MLNITVVDPTGVPRGRLLPLSAKAVLRLNDVDTYLVESAMDDASASKIAPGWSLVLDDGYTRLSGRASSIASVVEGGHRVLEIAGFGELHRLKDRLVYPNPSRAVDKQDVSHYKDSGPAEDVLKRLVAKNVSTLALPDRQSPRFEVEDSQGRGGLVAVSERLSSLLEVAQKIASTGGLVYSAVREDSGATVFRVREPRDLSRQYRFSADGTFTLSGPTGTAVILAQQGEGADRVISESARASEWGHRIEVFKDRRDTDDKATVETETAKLLAEKWESASASVTLVEGNGGVFGRDFQLGDIVTAQLDTTHVSEAITKAEITWDTFNRDVKISIGPDSSETTEAKLVKLYTDIASRLRNIESV